MHWNNDKFQLLPVICYAIAVKWSFRSDAIVGRSQRILHPVVPTQLSLFDVGGLPGVTQAPMAELWLITSRTVVSRNYIFISIATISPSPIGLWLMKAEVKWAARIDRHVDNIGG